MTKTANLHSSSAPSLACRSSRSLPRFALLVLLAALVGFAIGSFAAAQGPQVTVETSKGVILLELDAEAAPKSVENFLQYARDGFYDGTIFHRVISGFMVQGGGFTDDMKKKDVRAPIDNESKNGLSNSRGTIAMARTIDPHSATAQFYINHVDNESLDARGSNWGYAVFGRVVEGMDVVDAIAGTKTDIYQGRGRPMRDVPVEPVYITKVTVN